MAPLLKRIRDLQRSLKRLQSKGESTEALEAKLSELHDEKVLADQSKKEQKNATKYHLVKFVERQKVLRRINTIDQKIKGLAESAADNKDAPGIDARFKNERQKLIEKLAYILYYPNTMKYIALFAPDSEGNLELTEKLRAKAQELALEAWQTDKNIAGDEMDNLTRVLMHVPVEKKPTLKDKVKEIRERDRMSSRPGGIKPQQPRTGGGSSQDNNGNGIRSGARQSQVSYNTSVSAGTDKYGDGDNENDNTTGEDVNDDSHPSKRQRGVAAADSSEWAMSRKGNLVKRSNNNNTEAGQSEDRDGDNIDRDGDDNDAPAGAGAGAQKEKKKVKKIAAAYEPDAFFLEEEADVEAQQQADGDDGNFSHGNTSSYGNNGRKFASVGGGGSYNNGSSRNNNNSQYGGSGSFGAAAAAAASEPKSAEDYIELRRQKREAKLADKSGSGGSGGGGYGGGGYGNISYNSNSQYQQQQQRNGFSDSGNSNNNSNSRPSSSFSSGGTATGTATAFAGRGGGANSGNSGSKFGPQKSQSSSRGGGGKTDHGADKPLHKQELRLLRWQQKQQQQPQQRPHERSGRLTDANPGAYGPSGGFANSANKPPPRSNPQFKNDKRPSFEGNESKGRGGRDESRTTTTKFVQKRDHATAFTKPSRDDGKLSSRDDGKRKTNDFFEARKQQLLIPEEVQRSKVKGSIIESKGKKITFD